MLRVCAWVLALVACGWQDAGADTIQLKDKAAVVGKVLAEKRDQVAVDVGYTVLVIPRNQILKVSRTETAEASAKPIASKRVVAENEGKAEATTVESASGFYSVSNRALPARTVRDLVNQLGEAVVQVR